MEYEYNHFPFHTNRTLGRPGGFPISQTRRPLCYAARAFC